MARRAKKKDDLDGLRATFFALTPDRILETVEAQGLHTSGRCVALNSLENRVYDVELEPRPGEAPERVVMKFYRPGRWSKETILEEHGFLAELHAQGLPVVPPLDLAGGAGVTLGETQGIWYAGFPRRRGRPPEEMDEETLRRVGRLLAGIHNVGARAAAPHRPRIDPERMLVESSAELAARDLLPQGVETRYVAAARALAAIAQPWFAEAPAIRLHGDCHLGNLLVGVDGIVFVDFDDMQTGPPVQDVWLLVPGRDEEALRRRDLLLEGYEELRAFDRSTLRLVEVLRAMRFVAYSAWIARRWEDPSFPRAFPDFRTERYWVEELGMLEEQLEIVTREARGDPAGGGDDERAGGNGDVGGAGGEDDPAWKL